jgi:hypothetical protein
MPATAQTRPHGNRLFRRTVACSEIRQREEGVMELRARGKLRPGLLSTQPHCCVYNIMNTI